MATAQEKFEFVDSESIIQELANELQGEGEIDNQKMLDICKKINPNDTAYYGLLASQSYYL